ncbi:hypothetical protein [Modestobacter sp. SYSU DS0511]
MSTPDDQPTTVQRQVTAEQPAVTTGEAPARSRVWQRRLPSRIGRAHTSTVVIGALFVVLFALWLAARPAYVDVELPGGGTARVPCSQVSTCGEPTPSETPLPSESPLAPTDPTGPGTDAPAPTGQAPQTTGLDDDETPTTTPRTSRAPAPSTGTTGPTTTDETPTTGTEQGTDEEPTPSETPTG